MSNDKYTLKELIEALNIFLKYDNPKFPTGCEHDVLYVFDEGSYSPDKMDAVDVGRLNEIGFDYDASLPSWGCTAFGSG
jgi:hypothetical protein